MFSNYESFCVVIAEAWCCGKPVITSIAGGLTNLVHEGIGITVEKNNTVQLKEAMLRLSNSRANFDKLKIRDFATQLCSEKIIGAKLTEVYSTVLLQQEND